MSGRCSSASAARTSLRRAWGTRAEHVVDNTNEAVHKVRDRGLLLLGLRERKEAPDEGREGIDD